MKLRTLLLFLGTIGSALSQFSCNTNDTATVKIGSPYIVCIHFKNATGINKKAAFPVTADKYTALSLTGAYNLMVPSSTGNTVVIQTQNSNITLDAVFFFNDSNKIAQMMSFLIYVNNGVVETIEDDSSAFCSGCKGTCEKYNNTKGQQKSNCYVDASNSSSKDPKVFVAWMGTDSEGQYLLSQTYRIQKFTEYSMNNVFDSALNMFEKIAN